MDLFHKPRTAKIVNLDKDRIYNIMAQKVKTRNATETMEFFFKGFTPYKYSYDINKKEKK